MRRLVGLSSVLLLLACVLTGCGRTATALAEGDCIAGTTDDVRVADWVVVPCSRPHVYEIVGLEPVPTVYLSKGGPTTDDRDRLERVLENARDGAVPGNDADDAFDGYATGFCENAVLEALGLDELTIRDRTGFAAGIHESTQVSMPFVVVDDGTAWRAHHRIVCLNRFVGDTDDPDTSLRRVRGDVTHNFRTAGWPVDLRTCRSVDPTDDTALVRVRCSEPHLVQETVRFEASRTVPADVVARERTNDPDAAFSRSFYRRVDRACTGVLDDLLGDDWDRDTLVGFGERDGDWSPGSAASTVICYVRTRQSGTGLPAGDLIGAGASSITPVPMPGEPVA